MAALRKFKVTFVTGSQDAMYAVLVNALTFDAAVEQAKAMLKLDTNGAEHFTWDGIEIVDWQSSHVRYARLTEDEEGW